MCCNILALVIFICAYSLASFAVDALNILQIAPNYLDTNYDLSVRLANLLAERGHNVHFLLPLSKPDAQAPSAVKLSQQQNLKLQVCPLSLQTLEWMKRPPPDTDFMDPAPENIQQGGWSARHYKQSPAIVYVEAFAVIADIVKHGNCWDSLKQRHENAPFTVGLMDVWDFGALALFHALGIKNVVLTHNFPIMSHMYDYMGEAEWPNARGQTLNYKQQILKNGVPEVFAALVNNDSKIGKSDAFKAEHIASSLIFTTIYEQMDSQFKTLFKNDNFPPLKELFKNANYLFINSRRPLDYDLGTLPEKVKFIGGIDLMPNFPQSQLTSNEQKVFNENKKVIVFSMGTLLEPAKMPIDKFKTIVEGLAKLESMAVIWKYDAQQMVDHENRREFLEKNAPNVHIMPRFDTRSVLSNPKTRLLISECDSRSALDAVHAQKPLLCMPMFAEHFYVAEKLRRAGVAVVLLPHDTARITSDALVDSIKFVDANYAHFIDKMKVLHDEIENEKINPAELFLKAFEEIGKNSE